MSWRLGSPVFVQDDAQLVGRMTGVASPSITMSCPYLSSQLIYKAELLQKDFLQALVADEDKADARVRLKEVLEGKLDGAVICVQDMSEIKFCIDKECKIVEWTPKMENQSPIESLAPERLSLDNANCTDAWLSVVPWRSATGSIVGAVASFQDAEEVDRRLGEADWIRVAWLH
ncbi:hypothetical protein AK812_SmicGene36473 [Symbiodinium microadriaticum]|uniref:Uncharacterized protein n=1 Tax=Symbiodinium microadriaticum TaxID=2951 RepID=A0A1Q9CIT8_SYMMI|nr:hypothetical protein AK812_SmicGene36473 [Symbiodinium microadriaticum]